MSSATVCVIGTISFCPPTSEAPNPTLVVILAHSELGTLNWAVVSQHYVLGHFCP